MRHALYVRLSEDRELSHLIQAEMIANLKPDYVINLTSGHLPILSKPDELASILNRYGDERLSTENALT